MKTNNYKQIRSVLMQSKVAPETEAAVRSYAAKNGYTISAAISFILANWASAQKRKNNGG